MPGQSSAPESVSTKQKRGHWSALIWLAIGAFLIKYFAFDAVEKDRRVKANWELYNATIVKSEIVHKGLESGWQLNYAFEIELPSGKRQYNTSQTSGKGANPGKPVEGQFAIGNTLPVYLNPNNLAEFHRPKRQWGLRLIGYLGGGFFILTGLSVLFGKRNPKEEKA
ncbi:MAG: DUF3592 domain-containing protein [Verrucomicrobiota bacterium]